MHQQNIQAQHSYPFRSFSPNYPTNTMSYANTTTGINNGNNGVGGGTISPSSSSSSESNQNQTNININDIKTSFSSMKINRKDDN